MFVRAEHPFLSFALPVAYTSRYFFSVSLRLHSERFIATLAVIAATLQFLICYPLTSQADNAAVYVVNMTSSDSPDIEELSSPIAFVFATLVK